MNRMLNTTNIWVFISTFLFISFSILFITSIDKKNRIDAHLQNANHTFSTQYTTVYNSYMNMSKTAHSLIFDSPAILEILLKASSKDPKVVNEARKELYNLLVVKYKKLTKQGFKQLHFHTKNNHSFLRMHIPHKYGDDLTDIRYSVDYVNKNQKFIHGLEAGRIVHGFRFVYPMFYKNKYLGSVEISISSNAFVNSIEKAFDTDVHFIVDKKLIYSKLFDEHKELYENSIESPKFLALKEKSFDKNIRHIPKNILRENLGNEIDKNLKKEETFSLYMNYKGEFNVLTFIPLKNIKEKKVVAYLISYTKNEHIKKIHTDFIKINMVLIFLTFLILYFVYLLNKNKQKLLEEQRIVSENSRLESMREMIGNIAHHWRQPLSVISTTASSLKVQHELNILKDEYMDKSLNSIVKSTKELSKTIDDFKEYVTSQSEISTFDMQSLMKKVLVISSSSIETQYIQLLQNIDFELRIKSVESILVESIIKILNNSVDALQKVENHDDRFIFLTIKRVKGKLVITIKDSGGGIPDDLIEHVFEPYFTTKHQAVGTGLGLYTVRSNILNTLKGDIELTNTTYEYENKTFTGATFTITLPL